MLNMFVTACQILYSNTAVLQCARINTQFYTNPKHPSFITTFSTWSSLQSTEPLFYDQILHSMNMHILRNFPFTIKLFTPSFLISITICFNLFICIAILITHQQLHTSSLYYIHLSITSQTYVTQLHLKNAVIMES